MKKRYEKIETPTLSPGKLFADNFFLIKTVFKAAPGSMALFAFEQFRVSAMIFFEHTFLIKQVLDCVQYKRPFSDALVPILIIAGILIVTSVLGSVTGQWLQPKAILASETALKNMVFEKAKDIDLKNFDDPDYYNDFILAVEQIPELVAYIVDIIHVASSALGTLVTTGIYFAVESKPVFLLVFLSSAVYLVFGIVSSRMKYRRRAASKKYYRRMDYIKRLFYLPDYAKEIRLNEGVKESSFKKYEDTNNEVIAEMSARSKRILVVDTLNWGIQTVLLDFGTTLFLVYEAIVRKTIDYTAVIVMMNATWGLSRAFRNIAYKIATSAENCLYVEKIKSFLETKNDIVSLRGLPVNGSPCSLELKNVVFRYTEDGENVINGVSLKMEPGEKIALVGSNGAGKTTLIKLIMRLYDPNSGEIYLDGVNVKDYDVEKYRHNIGVVFQDFNIYAATIAENVAMDTYSHENDGEVESSLRHSGFGDRLDGAENGIDTELTKEFDDEGIDLSGGESQMVAIARAFYKDSGIIILDEPSSALDPISEYKFNRYMAEAAKDRTVIFISHRLSTTRLADRIIVLDEGRAKEEGTHEELLAAGGLYYKMWHAQADKYEM
ncbi:MAG: ABC transporter ATP-binding protein [Clostridia bacterium]|nr:ABC transporter ATP-binding protein [Clostridia bacterium]